jgi:hypothetical protein
MKDEEIKMHVNLLFNILLLLIGIFKQYTFIRFFMFAVCTKDGGNGITFGLCTLARSKKHMP